MLLALNGAFAEPYIEVVNKAPSKYLEQLDLENKVIADISYSLYEEGDSILERITKAFYYVGNNLSYIPETTEVEEIKTPYKTYLDKGGDCEDLALFLIALLENLGVENYMLYGKKHIAVMAGSFKNDELKSFSNQKIKTYTFDNNDYFLFLEATAGRYGYPGCGKVDMSDGTLVVNPTTYKIVGKIGDGDYKVSNGNSGVVDWSSVKSLELLEK